MSISTNEPLSSRVSMRSRAVILPASCCLSTARWLPACACSSRRRRSRSICSSVLIGSPEYGRSRRPPRVHGRQGSRTAGSAWIRLGSTPRRPVMATPFTVVALEVVDSTQDEARHRFSGDPLVVIAVAQRAGRGRTGTTWEAAPRAVAASLAWEPEWPESGLARLTPVAALAALALIGGGGPEGANHLIVGG